MFSLFLLLWQFTMTNTAALPNPAWTPGAVRPDILLQTICTTKWGKDRRHVTTHMRMEVFAQYGIAWTPANRKLYEVDHLIPRELGGADVLANLWPEPWEIDDAYGAHAKDKIENEAHRAVCGVWKISGDGWPASGVLFTLQRMFAENWLNIQPLIAQYRYSGGAK